MKIYLKMANSNINSPAYKRQHSIKKLLEGIGYEVLFNENENENEIDIYYFSFPPFLRILEIIRILFLKKPYILEIRDGWSVAILTGYGGTTTKKFFKGQLVRFLEYLLKRKSIAVVGVTPGLCHYLGGENLLFLPNGSNIGEKKGKRSVDLSKDSLKIICLGKFGNYGLNNVHQSLATLSARYHAKMLFLDVYSLDRQELEGVILPNNVSITLKAPVNQSEVSGVLAKYDIGVAIIRDQNYDFGTKIFDYIQSGLPVLDYFEEDGDIKRYFAGGFDTDFGSFESNLSREKLIEKHNAKVFFEKTISNSA